MLSALARTNFRIQERLLGRKTFAFLRELEQSEAGTRDTIQQLQLKRFQETVKHAYKHTEYWRSVMTAAAVAPADIRCIDDLQRFPLLEKETVRAQRERMVDRQGRRRLMIVRTSGSTNEALQFYTDSLREAQITAARIRGHQWIGINKGDREMYFWGSPIELSKQDHVKRFRDWLINDGLTNGFELNPELVRRYHDDWVRWRPKLIFGYPNSLALMAMMARPQNLDLTVFRERGLDSICTTSEMLTDPDRQLISKAFGVPVYDSYGLREVGLIGHECKYQSMHTMDEQFLFETVDPQTLEPTDGEGELVVTSIYSTVMPMIRYRTGDIVTLSSEACRCGLPLNRLSISGGRVADFVVTTDGRWIPGYAFIYICRSIPGIIKFQVQQDRVGEVHVLVAADDQFPHDGLVRVIEQTRERLQSDDRVTAERVDNIHPSASGKYRPVVSRVAQEKLAEVSRHDAIS